MMTEAAQGINADSRECFSTGFMKQLKPALYRLQLLTSTN